jgi:hypothetical protein
MKSKVDKKSNTHECIRCDKKTNGGILCKRCKTYATNLFHKMFKQELKNLNIN